MGGLHSLPCDCFDGEKRRGSPSARAGGDGAFNTQSSSASSAAFVALFEASFFCAQRGPRGHLSCARPCTNTVYVTQYKSVTAK